MGRFPFFVVEALRMRSETARLIDRVLHSMGRKRRFYSSKSQDRWAIQHIFREARGGYFVELGAGDGRTHSNTFVLERDYDWTGVVVEANPSFSDALKANRTCHCVSACLSSDVEMRDYFCFGHLGGIIAEDADNSWKKRALLLKRHRHKIVKMTCKTLEEVLIDVGAPKKIEFLSIDIEGAEYLVLKNFPFEVYSFEAIVVERPTKKLHALLSRAGYILERVYRHDGFYLSGERASLLGVEALPFAGMNEKPF